jgi:hypothetical protein
MDQTSQAKGDHHQGGFGLFPVGMGEAVYVFLPGLAILKFGPPEIENARRKGRGTTFAGPPACQELPAIQYRPK